MFNRFRRQTSTTPTGAPEFLVVGLGNPGNKYTYTRHNSGFLCLDMLSDKLNIRIDRLKFKSLICDTNINGHRCIVMKPQTFMNNSGEAVRECASFYKIPAEKVIVIYDDISLDVGKLRIRRKGTDGGHNGIKSIIYHLNSDQFPRIKLGCGKKPHPDYDLIDWVISEFKKDELKALEPALSNACKALELMLDNNIEKAMNLYNS
ncbi:MAG: aminoacyl-tRNA hydrolase [Clostridia bacterium]|nr:aminoacyl-tRNA hydrolase [Clostridia bacterium]